MYDVRGMDIIRFPFTAKDDFIPPRKDQIMNLYVIPFYVIQQSMDAVLYRLHRYPLHKNILQDRKSAD